jgi:hypothetical protein
MHFTYQPPTFDQLRQGDVLKKTPELLQLISTIHPHYAGEGYLYFQVITQSCDLVRRSGQLCKSRYITLAAVRSLDLIIERAIEKFDDRVDFNGALLCSKRHKRALSDVLNKLYNNNDTNHFFLNAAIEFGLPQDCCTQLHLSISIRAYEHYDVCLNAKIVELKESFRAKLGWLVGNLYSRVGTEDYVPGAIADNSAYDAFLNARMDDFVGWIPESEFSEFRSRVGKSNSIEEVLEQVRQKKQQTKEQRLNQLVQAVAKGVGISPDQIEKLKNVLSQHPLITRALDK